MHRAGSRRGLCNRVSLILVGLLLAVSGSGCSRTPAASSPALIYDTVRDDFPRGIACAQGRVVLVGETWGDGSLSQAWALVTAESASPDWTQTFGGGRPAGFEAVAAATDGFLAVGWVKSIDTRGRTKGYAEKVAWDGSEEWETEFGPPEADSRFSCVSSLSDGGYALAGTSNMVDAWVLRLDAKGGQLWTLSLGPEVNPHGIVELPGGDLLVAGGLQTRNEPYQSFRTFVALVGPDGKSHWSRSLDDALNLGTEDPGRSQIEWAGRTSDGRPVIGGTTPASSWVALLSPDGTVAWSAGLLAETTVGAGSTDGGCTVLGTLSDAWVARLDAGGGAVWKTSLGIPGGTGTAICADAAGACWAAGYVRSATGNAGVWLVRVSPSGDVVR